jgi:hypothetical protein
VLALVDHHLLAAGPRLLGERQLDQAVLDRRHADHQRPVDLSRRSPGEALGEERRAARRRRDQQDPGGVLVEPMDKARPRPVHGKGIEQAVDVLISPAAALGRKARRLVEYDRRAVAVDRHCLGLLDLRLGEFTPGPRRARRRCQTARGHAQHLPGGEPVGRVGALAVDADLSGARPARHGGEADLRQVALEPPVEPHAVVVGRDGELADRIGRFFAHQTLRIIASPPNIPPSPASSVTAT